MGSRTEAVGRRCTTWAHTPKSRCKSLFLNRSEGSCEAYWCLCERACVYAFQGAQATVPDASSWTEYPSEIEITASWQLELPRAFSFQCLAALTLDCT